MLYPLTFEPLFKSMLWGGRRLPSFLGRPEPHADPIGEAWVLSDVEGNASVVANGPLAGRTLRQLIAEHRRELLGNADAPDGRFPLLLKFIDARQELSVQVHPNDELAVQLAGPGKRGKTEAWVVLDRDPATSRIYAGFRPGVTADEFRKAMAAKTTPQTLHSFTPTPGDCVFLRAGTVHAIGANILLFEVQQTSDITYRLYDWDRIDAKTGKGRELHIEHGLMCSDFTTGPCHPVTPKVVDGWEKLVNCEYFTLRRRSSTRRFTVGAKGQCRIVAVIDADSRSEIEWEDVNGIKTGDVILFPASVGECTILPAGRVTLLECGLPG